MSELRWILLGLGLLLIGTIYLLSRRGQADSADDFEQGRRIAPELEENHSHEPTTASRTTSLGERANTSDSTADPRIGDEHAAPAVDSDGQNSHTHEPPVDSGHAPAMAEKVIALHLVPNPNEYFPGTEFVEALQSEGLQFGRFDIFHRFAESDQVTEDTPSLFSVANIIKPGTLSLNDLDRQELKGASMFLVLPGPADPVAAFSDMVATGRRLAATLNGQLLDGHGTKLSRQRASHLREDIINYQHGLSTADSTIA